MTYRYRILAPSEDRRREKDEKSRREMDLAFVASEVASMMCKIKCPSIRFITACDHGEVVMNRLIDGYCSNGNEIFLRTGLTPGRLVEVTIHECRHAQQWLKPGYAGRSDHHAEADASTFVHEFWGERRIETDPEKILPQLCEIGAPLAMTAGEELAAQFYVEELKATGHPAAARLDRQYVEWCRNRERAEGSRISDIKSDWPAITAAQMRDYYYRVALPKIAAAHVKPHLNPFRIEYSVGEYQRERNQISER